MNVRIRDHGHLEIQRGSLFREQYCPFSANGELARCGDWCPLFQANAAPHERTLILCQGRIYSHIDILDERK